MGKHSIYIALVAVIISAGLFIASTARRPHQASVPSRQRLASDSLATIEVSQSTNTSPYSITMFTDGSATRVASYDTRVSGHAKPEVNTKNYGPGSVDAKTLESLLQDIGDVSRLTTGHPCPKPVSFATTMQITYSGKTSGDISCPAADWPQAGFELKKFIDEMQTSLSRS
jgi:hypothetical protein